MDSPEQRPGATSSGDSAERPPWGGDLPAPDGASPDVEAVYDELRGLARRALGGQRVDHTLQATALVHEAWMRLANRPDGGFADRTHFFATAARAMRHVLVDHARRVAAAKRGGDQARVTLHSGDAGVTGAAPTDVLDLDGALARLEQEDPRLGRVVELKFFAGMTLDEMAEALAVSAVTVSKDWKRARLWLARELTR